MQWLSCRVLDSRPRGRGFEPHQCYCIVSLSKNINPSLELVQPRKIRPFITERLLIGHKESNQTNKFCDKEIWRPQHDCVSFRRFFWGPTTYVLVEKKEKHFSGGPKKLTSNSHVSEEQPTSDETFLRITWWLLHNVKVRWVEAESCCRETVSDQVDPQQLYWDQSFWDTKSGCQEDTVKKQTNDYKQGSKL